MIRADFTPDYGLSVAGPAGALGVSRQRVNELLRKRRALSPEMALRLAHVFDKSPDFSLNARRPVDLWDAERSIGAKLRRIKPLRAA